MVMLAAVVDDVVIVVVDDEVVVDGVAVVPGIVVSFVVPFVGFEEGTKEEDLNVVLT